MNKKYSCPVCGRRGLPQGCARCPQCDADLTCFHVLDAIAPPAAAKPPAKSCRWPLVAVLIFLVALLLSFLGLNMSSRVKEIDQKLAQLKAAEKNKPVIVQQEEKPVVAEPAEVPTKHEEVSAVLPGKIVVDTQVKMVDGQQETGENSAYSAATASSAAPTEAAVQQTEPNEEGKAQFKQETVAVADSDSTPAAAKEPHAVQSAAEEEIKTEEQLAGRPKDIPVLKARPKRLVRAKPSESSATIQEKQAADDGASTNARPLQKESKPARSTETFLYEARSGETLQDIAERFYGDRRYYPVILDQNPYLISNINSGNWMRLFVDARSAAALYVHRTLQLDGLLLWKYQVRPGETWRTIYARFFPPRYSGRVFYEKDPQIAPGRTVLIILR